MNTMMLNLPQNILKNLKKLVPSSLINEIACFVFYDDHPRDQRNINITICTLNGEVKEFYDKELVSSISLNVIPLEVRILRNSQCKLFYLVSSSENLYILLREEKLKLHTKVDNVDTYTLEETTCFGQSSLKVVCKDDAVPLVFDDNFQCIEKRAVLLNPIQDQTIPLLIELQRKLTEAKYCVKSNKKELNDLIHLRQISAIDKYEEIRPNTCDTVFNAIKKEITNDISLKTRTPWVKFCNNKIVLILNLTNNNGSVPPIEDLHLFLYESTQTSLVYETNLYERSATSPFWIKKRKNILSNNTESAVVCVTELNEVEYNVNSVIELNCVLCYKKAGTERLSHLDNINIPPKIIMTDEYNILSNFESDDPNIVLAVMATSNLNELKLIRIRPEVLPICWRDVFCEYLSMEPIPFAKNVFLHRSSSYHPLNGLMVVLPNIHKENLQSEAISIYTRTPAQLLLLIKLIYDTVPQRILVMSSNHRITAKSDELAIYTENRMNDINMDYTECVLAISRQLASVLEHLDKCNIKMNADRKRDSVKKIGHEIDLLADGASSFEQFRDKFMEEMKAISCFGYNPDSSN